MTSMAYLNGNYLPLSEARISPMDRGFLFGDGIYEVIPAYAGRMVGFGLHIERLQQGLIATGIPLEWSPEQWRELCERLLRENGGGDLAVYLHVSRGDEGRRFHAYPENLTPTLFAFAYPIAPEPLADRERSKRYRVASSEDLRWQRCHIKSTALLGNVMHFQQGHAAGMDETLLYNRQGELTEGSASNVFIVRNGEVFTPPLDQQILPGITRHILIEILRRDGRIPIEERPISMDEVHQADEIWLTSSSKEIAPVVSIDGRTLGDGRPGPIWEQAQRLFSAHKYDY